MSSLSRGNPRAPHNTIASSSLPMNTGTNILRTRPYGVQEGIDAEVGTSVTVLYSKMRRIENDGRLHRPDAKYLPYRRLLVDWICECGEHYKLFNSTQHVAVGYLDKALQLMDVHDDRLQAVAMACLLIAAKYEEKEESCPSALQLVYYVANDLLKDSYHIPLHPQTGLPTVQTLEDLASRDRRIPSIGLVHQMEVLLLNRLNWSLTIVSPLHYLGLFHRQGILFENDTLGYKPLRPAVIRFLVRYTDFFADFCLQDYAFNEYNPSLLAAAMVLTARRALNIVPIWNNALQDVLGYNENELQKVYDTVWKYYAVSFPAKVQEADDLAAAAVREAIENGILPRPSDTNNDTKILLNPSNSSSVLNVVSPNHNHTLSLSSSSSSSAYPNSSTPQSAMNMTIVATPATGMKISPSDNHPYGYFSGGTMNHSNGNENNNYQTFDTNGVNQQLNFSGVYASGSTVLMNNVSAKSSHSHSSSTGKGSENHHHPYPTKEQQQQQYQQQTVHHQQGIGSILSPMNQR